MESFPGLCLAPGEGGAHISFPPLWRGHYAFGQKVTFQSDRGIKIAAVELWSYWECLTNGCYNKNGITNVYMTTRF